MTRDGRLFVVADGRDHAVCRFTSTHRPGRGDPWGQPFLTGSWQEATLLDCGGTWLVKVGMWAEDHYAGVIEEGSQWWESNDGKRWRSVPGTTPKAARVATRVAHLGRGARTSA